MKRGRSIGPSNIKNILESVTAETVLNSCLCWKIILICYTVDLITLNISGIDNLLKYQLSLSELLSMGLGFTTPQKHQTLVVFSRILKTRTRLHSMYSF